MFGQDKKKSGFAKVSKNLKTKALKANNSYKKGISQGVYKAANASGYVAGKASKIPRIRNNAARIGQTKPVKAISKTLGRVRVKGDKTGIRTSAAAAKGYARGVLS
jgi:hypothetical protein